MEINYIPIVAVVVLISIIWFSAFRWFAKDGDFFDKLLGAVIGIFMAGGTGFIVLHLILIPIILIPTTFGKTEVLEKIQCGKFLFKHLISPETKQPLFIDFKGQRYYFGYETVRDDRCGRIKTFSIEEVDETSEPKILRLKTKRHLDSDFYNRFITPNFPGQGELTVYKILVPKRSETSNTGGNQK